MEVKFDIDDRIVAPGRALMRGLSSVTGRLVLLCLVAGSATLADAASKPHDFAGGSVLSANDLNDNFDVLYESVTALEERLDAVTGTVALAGAVFTSNSASLNGYSYASAASKQVFGHAPVALPAGAVVNSMTCHFLNNSDVASGQMFASLQRVSLGSVSATVNGASAVARVDTWLGKSTELQAVDVAVSPGHVAVEGDPYFIQFTIDVSAADDALVYPAADNIEDRRVLRFYGCNVHYSFP